MTSTKKLIVDCIPFQLTPTMLNEVAKAGDSDIVIVKGILQKANEKNQNGRRYPKKILEREVENYKKNFINERRALGELDHPSSPVVELKNVSHNITEIHWEGDNLIGTVEILPTPSGNILKKLMKSNIRLGISSRGDGTVTEGIDGVIVNEDFSLIAWDFVSNPSTRGAFMSPQTINENVTDVRSEFKYAKIENLIRDCLVEMS